MVEYRSISLLLVYGLRRSSISQTHSKTRRLSSCIDQTNLVNKGLITWHYGHNFLAEQRVIPSKLACCLLLHLPAISACRTWSTDHLCKCPYIWIPVDFPRKGPSPRRTPNKMCFVESTKLDPCSCLGNAPHTLGSEKKNVYILSKRPVQTVMIVDDSQ